MASAPEPSPDNKNPLEVLDALADASWDLFVMPGEAANSVYDRPLEPIDSGPVDRPTFNWAGNETQNDALRLPSGGVKAAERLSVPVGRPKGRWYEKEGRDIAGDVEYLTREWTRLWAVCVAITFVVLAADNWDALVPPASAAEAPPALVQLPSTAAIGLLVSESAGAGDGLLAWIAQNAALETAGLGLVALGFAWAVASDPKRSW